MFYTVQHGADSTLHKALCYLVTVPLMAYNLRENDNVSYFFRFCDHRAK